jgi:hypothetical protein
LGFGNGLRMENLDNLICASLNTVLSTLKNLTVGLLMD